MRRADFRARQNTICYGHDEITEKQRPELAKKWTGKIPALAHANLRDVVWRDRFFGLTHSLDQPVVFQNGKVLLVGCQHSLYLRFDRNLCSNLLVVF